MTTLACRMVRLRLASLDRPDSLGGPLAAHASTCLACQAETARHRRLRRNLTALSDHVESAPPGLLPEVESRLGQRAPDAAAQPRAATFAAAAGAVVAAAGTVAMVRWMKARSAA